MSRWLWPIVSVLSLVLIATAVLPCLPVNWWWVRIGDFPRLQLIAIYAISIPIVLMFWKRRYSRLLACGLLMGIGIQVYWVFPYLPIAPHEVEWNLSTRRDSRLKILSANVLQENNSAERLLKLIEHHAPDVVVLCEVNQAWLERLRPVELQFDFQLVHPQENKYGIALYSNLEVATATVRRLVRDDIPSIDATIRLESGQVVRLFAVHPNPPRPGEDTTKRDGELILVGREVREDPTAIVLGDLNDVGWSRTTNLFQEVSGLLDPRKGRGFFSTFDATSMFWRYPLDYLFHSDDFRVVRLQVLTDIGSDHFPLFVELSHEPAAAFSQETPDLDAGDREDAQDSVEAAKQAR